MKIKLAILEKDSNYLNKLANMFDKKFMDKLQIYSFTNEDTALETILNTKIDIFLVCEEYKIDPEKLPNMCGFAYLTDSKDLDTLHGVRAICKFQRSELIYKEILGLHAEKISEKSHVVFGGNASSLYTFVSASGGVGSSTMAASCAIHLANEGKKVLYINLEQFGDSQLFFEAEGNGNLSEVLYAVKSKKPNISLRIESNVKLDKSGVYFYDSCKVPFDVMEIGGEDIVNLFSQISAIGVYDYIVVDADFLLNEMMTEVFKLSRSIIFTSDGSEISNIKFKKAYAALEIFEEQINTRILNKIGIVYNRFRSRTSTRLEKVDIKVLGGAQQFEGASIKQIMDELSKIHFIAELSH